ncbi:MAG: hypothetical protein J2P48_03645 [Alphaproteobacteria bacterium]|nr:hypothetical protein [Alphaproteobacteria bacterium]
MALRIETFDNTRGGNTLYKALTHPRAAEPAKALLDELARHAPVAVYDPIGAIEGFDAIFGLDRIAISGVYVQQIARVGSPTLGRAAQPVTELCRCAARSVFVCAFDAQRGITQLQPFLPENAAVFSLDHMRIPVDRLTNHRRYLDPINFATNFAFFRDAGGLHTRLVTTNYWSGYGAGAVTCWMTLFGGNGVVLAEWCERHGPSADTIVVDSRKTRERFGLPEFAGQLFLHIVGAAGHDVVKYALDTFGYTRSSEAGADISLSCTHDANAWPADRYAGLPAPAAGEQVLLWIQNSHPVAIPPGAVGFNRMGANCVVPIGEPLAPFATRAVDVGDVLPDVRWPEQVELRAAKHMVRPRYEVVERGRRRIAHVNVERGDLRPDPEIPRLTHTLGKGYLLPAPVLPIATWQTLVLPTPMTVRQAELPIAARIYDRHGAEIASHSFGRLPRAHATALDLDAIEGLDSLRESYGHIELVYEFAAGGEADGWLHALFRYRHRRSGHAAETSFGAHVFNTILTYRDEPQSYTGPPPGLSTRLYLRLGEDGYDTLCQLIYPASRAWLPTSTTDIILYAADGREIARAGLAIPCSGSRLWYYHATFDPKTRARAGAGAYVIIRDTTCRLFGYHGLVGRDGTFSLDHMFGF